MCSVLAWCSLSADEDLFRQLLSRTVSRGPDLTKVYDTGWGLMGFNRLSIMGLTESDMQPFLMDDYICILTR